LNDEEKYSKKRSSKRNVKFGEEAFSQKIGGRRKAAAKNQWKMEKPA